MIFEWMTALGFNLPVSLANPMPVQLAGDVAAEYETVAASQTDQPMGATGAIGDFLARILVVPSSTSPGAVQIKDGAGSAITVFAGGVASITSLVPFSIPLNLYSLSAGGWKITSGANETLLVSGNFT